MPSTFVKTASGKKFHAGVCWITTEGIIHFTAICNQASSGWQKEPRADEVSCKKCLRKVKDAT